MHFKEKIQLKWVQTGKEIFMLIVMYIVNKSIKILEYGKEFLKFSDMFLIEMIISKTGYISGYQIKLLMNKQNTKVINILI